MMVRCVMITSPPTLAGRGGGGLLSVPAPEGPDPATTFSAAELWTPCCHLGSPLQWLPLVSSSNLFHPKHKLILLPLCISSLFQLVAGFPKVVLITKALLVVESVDIFCLTPSGPLCDFHPGTSVTYSPPASLTAASSLLTTFLPPLSHTCFSWGSVLGPLSFPLYKFSPGNVIPFPTSTCQKHTYLCPELQAHLPNCLLNGQRPPSLGN